MRFLAAATLAAFSALVAAQDATDLPQCSVSSVCAPGWLFSIARGARLQTVFSDILLHQLPCFIQYVPQTGCQLQDYTCQCTTDHQNQIRDPITQCVAKQCPNSSDQTKTLQTTQAICQKYGPAPGGSSPSNSTASASGGGGIGGGMSTSTGQAFPTHTGPVPTAFTAGADPATVGRSDLVGSGLLAGLVGLMIV